MLHFRGGIEGKAGAVREWKWWGPYPSLSREEQHGGPQVEHSEPGVGSLWRVHVQGHTYKWLTGPPGKVCACYWILRNEPSRTIWGQRSTRSVKRRPDEGAPSYGGTGPYRTYKMQSDNFKCIPPSSKGETMLGWNQSINTFPEFPPQSPSPGKVA
jgi:hypothetical protein